MTHVRPAAGPARGALLALLCAALVVAACGGSTPTVTPQALPTATASALQLPDPTSAGDVYTALRKQGITVVATNAVAGKEPLSRINATYVGQPLTIMAYSSDLARAKLYAFRDETKPERGAPTYTYGGLNVIVEFGLKTSGKVPAPADSSMGTAAGELATVLERLLGPLDERSFERSSTPKPTPSPSPPPTPTAAPASVTPKPS
jgi:hypothetical protein